ncbi:MAG: ABC transporter permease, partial [Rickettsiales bacterium]|nr:ABC transporter permease [Rickettsiales bacterium]
VQLEIAKQVEGFSANTMIVFPASQTKNGVRGLRGGRPTLTVGDMWDLKKVKNIVAVTPVNVTSAQIIYENYNWPTKIYGTGPDIMISDKLEMNEGDMFTDEDSFGNGGAFAVIGNTVKNKLFPFESPIGKNIKIRGVPFKIIGSIKEKGAGLGGADSDDFVLTPLKAFKTRLTSNAFPDRVYLLVVVFDNLENMAIVERRVNALLEVRHRVALNADPDFEVINLSAIVQKIEMIGVVLTILLASIASISLFVGSIGIMNMMLTSVTERTREIGVRKAIGATDNNILLQFLMESVFISAFGGFAGMCFGIGFSKLAQYLIEYEVPISATTITVSILSSLFVGVVSGIFPAIKATNLNTIDALRYQ